MTTALARGLFLIILVSLGACAAKQGVVPPGTTNADQFLFTQGQVALKDRKWLQAREYFRQIVDNYPQSEYRPDAKLAVGDTYIGEDTTESLLLGINEYREFLTFYPTHARADHAQYRLSYAYTQQMLGADRDQSATRDAIKELELFVQRYPNSALLPEAQKLLRESLDRLSESSYRVGFYYYRAKYYAGAIDRFREIVKSDPEYTGRDAVYFYLAESLMRLADQVPDQAAARKAEALPYYERVVTEFEQSEYLERSKKRIEELKGSADLSGFFDARRGRLRDIAAFEASRLADRSVESRVDDGSTRYRSSRRGSLGSTGRSSMSRSQRPDYDARSQRLPAQRIPFPLGTSRPILPGYCCDADCQPATASIPGNSEHRSEHSGRGAVFFHLAESLLFTDNNNKPEALPYYERLISEFEQSEFLERSRKRVAELKGGQFTRK